MIDIRELKNPAVDSAEALPLHLSIEVVDPVMAEILRHKTEIERLRIG